MPRMCMAYRLVLPRTDVGPCSYGSHACDLCGFLQAQLSAMKAMGQPAAGKTSPTAAPAGSRGPSGSGIPADPAAAMQRLEENLKVRDRMPVLAFPKPVEVKLVPPRGSAMELLVMHCGPAVLRCTRGSTTHSTRFCQAGRTQFHVCSSLCGAPVRLQVAMAARAELESRELLLRQQLDSTQVNRACFNFRMRVCSPQKVAHA